MSKSTTEINLNKVGLLPKTNLLGPNKKTLVPTFKAMPSKNNETNSSGIHTKNDEQFKKFEEIFDSYNQQINQLKTIIAENAEQHKKNEENLALEFKSTTSALETKLSEHEEQNKDLITKLALAEAKLANEQIEQSKELKDLINQQVQLTKEILQNDISEQQKQSLEFNEKLTQTTEKLSLAQENHQHEFQKIIDENEEHNQQLNEKLTQTSEKFALIYKAQNEELKEELVKQIKLTNESLENKLTLSTTQELTSLNDKIESSIHSANILASYLLTVDIDQCGFSATIGSLALNQQALMLDVNKLGLLEEESVLKQIDEEEFKNSENVRLFEAQKYSLTKAMQTFNSAPALTGAKNLTIEHFKDLLNQNFTLSESEINDEINIALSGNGESEITENV